jgi:hypothetical protein
MRPCFAQELGTLTRRGPWAGRVLSVHPCALNILRSDGLVVSVVADSTFMSAMGIHSPGIFETHLDPIPVDTPVVMEKAVLRIGDLAFIDCAGGQAWEGAIDGASVRTLSPAVVKTIRERLFANGNPAGLLGVLLEYGNVFVEHACAALARGRPEELVGCGPGLTPAGDDFLTGIMLASPASFSPLLERALPGTTPAGRTLLWMAMRGRFPAYLVTFIKAITAAAGSVEAIDAAVRSACAHGETSGTDALAGLCWQMLSNHMQPDTRTGVEQ